MKTRLAEVEAELVERWPESRTAPDLARMTAFMALLGDPQHAAPAVHLTGTNGKTSTARMIDELLRTTGRRVGRYTSPHLESVRERIVIDGRPISADAFIATYDTVRPVLEKLDREMPVRLSFFEVVTAMAFVSFAREGVDASVIEVGMGGMWDATNVVAGRVAVITPISLDHTSYLGPDEASIAAEKAGIIKAAAATVVLAPQLPSAEEVLHRRAQAEGVPVRRACDAARQTSHSFGQHGQTFHLHIGGCGYPIFLPLLGDHQADNAEVALCAAEAFLAVDGERLSWAQVRRGFARVQAPGRLEMVSTGPPVLVDASHNPAGMATTLTAVREALGPTSLIAVLAVLADKDVTGLVQAATASCDSLIVSENASPRACPALELAAIARNTPGAPSAVVAPRLEAAIDIALELAASQTASGDRPVVLITGSVVTAGRARPIVRQREARSDKHRVG